MSQSCGYISLHSSHSLRLGNGWLLSSPQASICVSVQTDSKALTKMASPTSPSLCFLIKRPPGSCRPHVRSERCLWLWKPIWHWQPHHHWEPGSSPSPSPLPRRQTSARYPSQAFKVTQGECWKIPDDKISTLWPKDKLKDDTRSPFFLLIDFLNLVTSMISLLYNYLNVILRSAAVVHACIHSTGSLTKLWLPWIRASVSMVAHFFSCAPGRFFPPYLGFCMGGVFQFIALLPW